MSSPTASTEHRQALRLGGRKLVLMAFSSLGIIYSDIGTSPLYVLTTLWSTSGPAPVKEDVIGGISAIIWAFTLLPFLKYIVFALSFGSGEGEGGPFALFQQIFPHNDPDRDPNHDRELTKHVDVSGTNKRVVAQGSKLQKLRWPLQIWTLFATALTMADGILTPAVSVTSSVGGLAVVAPVVAENVVPISIGFIIALFCGQRFGTAKLSVVFAPLTFLWFALIGIAGIINVTTQPSILRAFDPSRAIMFFVRTKNYDALAGVLLALTGCEAIFANLGQFTASSIRISFLCLVYPALIFQYLGQGARLIADGDNVMANPFYLSIPGGPNGPLWWITWIMGVFATLIASQAMITATFTLVNQLIGMGSFPSIRINHTSNMTAGQVYVPAVNWLLMIGTVATVAAFGSSFALTLAYGFAVATVMFITTTLISLNIPLVKGYHWSLGVLFFLFFGFLDALFWGAAIRKIPEGAWFPLALGSSLCIFMVFWTWGQELEHKFDASHSTKLNLVVFHDDKASDTKSDDSKDESTSKIHDVEREVPVLEGSSRTSMEEKRDRIACDSHGDFYIKKPDGTMVELARTTTAAIFYKAAGQGVPHAFSTFLHQVPALPRVIIFLSTWTVARPHVETEDRYHVTKSRSLDGFYGVTMKRGYLDRFNPDVEHIIRQIQTIEARFSSKDIVKRMARIMEASKTVTHINSSYRLMSRHQNNRIVDWVRRILIEELYGRFRIMFPDETSSPDSLEETLHVGVIAQI